MEKPLSRRTVEREIERFLDTADREELDTFVAEGTESALRRFRKRLRPGSAPQGLAHGAELTGPV